MIRDADKTDIGGIRELMNSIPGFWDETWPADVLERALGSSDTVALVHQDGDAIDGFVCAHDLAFRGYLSELVVSSGARSRGIGSRLVAEIERRLADRGCSVLVADVWRDAEGFYHATGWSPPPVVLLRKRLSKATLESDRPGQPRRHAGGPASRDD